MNAEQEKFMKLGILPARLNAQQTAWYLGFELHEISILVAKGLLRPLGHPKPNGIKFFSTVELTQWRDDAKLLSRGTDAVQAHWREKNQSKRPRNRLRGSPSPSMEGLPEQCARIDRPAQV